MRAEQLFSVRRPPEVVFDYLPDPSKLADWQTSKTSVEQLTDGGPQLGTRVRERTKPLGGKEFEQIVEFTELDRPRRVHMHIVEGPYPFERVRIATHVGVAVAFYRRADVIRREDATLTVLLDEVLPGEWDALNASPLQWAVRAGSP